jgi:large subunit ribosomal protein L15
MSEKAKKSEQGTSLTLADLRPAKGSTRKRLRVGRGMASGAGKTSNRGHRGEGQRSGCSRKRGFEGGQMPGFRRIPKLRRYTPPGRLDWIVVNVRDLEKLAGGTDSITYDALREKGLLKHGVGGLRVLGMGELKKKLTIEAHHVSESARQKIEAAGGSVKLLGDEA